MAGLSGPDGNQPARAVEPRRARGVGGSTLIELLVATAIMGTAVVALLVGSTTTFTTSSANRDQTKAGIVARDYAESLSVAVTTANWCSASYVVSYVPPPDFPVAVAYPLGCPSATSGTPQFEPVTITVTSPSGGQETLKTVIRQP